MKRWIGSLVIGSALVACQTQTNTSAVSQEATGSCPGQNNYPGAKLPKISYWNGTIPAPTGTQMLITFPDPNVQGETLIFLADPGNGTIPWGARFKNQDLPQVRAGVGLASLLDGGRRPPPPPPVGDDWLASYTLELVLDMSLAPDRAAANVLHPVFP